MSSILVSVVDARLGIDPFFRILNHYFKPPVTVLDVTFGRGSSWSGHDLLSRTLFDDKVYTIYKSDAHPEKGLDTVAHWSFLPYRSKSVHVIYYDPPFLLNAKNFDIGGKRDYYKDRHVDRHGKRVTFPLDFARVAARGCIVKIQDIHNEGLFYAQHIDIVNAAYATGYWYLYDIVVSRYNKHITTRSPYAIPVHNYYLIFKRTQKDFEDNYCDEVLPV